MVRRSPNNLAFDLEADEVVEYEKSVEESQQEQSNCDQARQLKKRVSAFNKRRRMSLWVSATQGANSVVPSQKPKFRSGKSLCPVGEFPRRKTGLSRSNEFNDGLFPSLQKVSLDSASPVLSVGTNKSIV
jgi:hypothetical protein